jgi:ApbE superfamily uncharacterized protein (UPF0280 family)
MSDNQYQARKYRKWVKAKDLISFHAMIYETDLMICADKNLITEARNVIKQYRNEIINYINTDKRFETSLIPIEVSDDAPAIIQTMGAAGHVAGTGPFAAVAGAISEFVGRELLNFSSQVIVENGGDIYIKSKQDRVIGIFAGTSPLTGKMGILIKATQTPLGICTSSGTVGHSKSFGKADAVIIMSANTALADAVATATANMIKTKDDIDKALNFAGQIKDVTGVIAIVGSHLGICGEYEIIKL